MLPKKKIIVRKKRLTVEDLQKEVPDIYTLVQVARSNNIIVNGSKSHMCRLLLNRLYGIKTQVISPEIRICCFYQRYFLWKLGIPDNITEPINSDDFYTGQNINRIPKVFVFYSEYNNIITCFDIRSLYEYNKEERVIKNPYTSVQFNIKTCERFNRKIKWLQKLGFPIQHQKQKKLPPKSNVQIDQYITDVFQILNDTHYVDSKWFKDLDFTQLKQLYKEVNYLWTTRIGLTEKQKKDIVKDGVVFNNYDNISNYPPSMKTKLQYQVLRNLERLITEGKTSAERNNGGLYFLIAFTKISKDVAKFHTSLIGIS